MRGALVICCWIIRLRLSFTNTFVDNNCLLVLNLIGGAHYGMPAPSHHFLFNKRERDTLQTLGFIISNNGKAAMLTDGESQVADIR